MVIKTVLPHLADAEYVSRFRDEAKVVVKLSHGNLIPVFDAGLVGGELFLAMEFVEGRDLRAVWNRCAKKQVAFPIDVAVYIVKELCRGLAYAHSFPDLNLVHRDVSPPNILLSYSGEVKLTDFGLAASSLKLEKTAPGIIYGKVAYMSPEQARGEKLDGRSDMYASGIVLWELLTGRQLFPPGKDQPQDLIVRAKNPDAPRPSRRAPRVPVELDEICLKALGPEKHDRYQDCDAMRMALQQWLATNAPTTDGSRMAAFLKDLFADDILRERQERDEMISRIRTRALTLPPSDDLRKMVEQSATGAADPGRAAEPPPAEASVGSDDAPVRMPGSVGRRAVDRGDEVLTDRRREVDRRAQVMRQSQGSIATAIAPRADASFELDIGAEIDGRYRIVELLGEGGMGKVYLAEHVEIGKRVALKVLHPSYSRMPDLVERFRREARAASKIGHPNIVDVTDSGSTEGGSAYFVMEYLEGVELGSVIEREGALDVARALRIAGQICRALSAAHREQIIHRDLKPENIYLISRGGEADVVKVLDFGIAKTTEAEAARERKLTSPGMAMGTPEYMAPEQAAGRAADARTDIYSLGAIMYEMVTGLPPYQGDNFMEILTKKATVDPMPPVVVRAELPLEVSDLVMTAMARRAADRPPSMDALEYELNKCLSGRGAAVAQILGMALDANLVASVNPGLSARNLDEGIVHRTYARSTTNEVWETRSGVSRAASSPSGQHIIRPPVEAIAAAVDRISYPVVAGARSGPIDDRAASPVRHELLDTETDSPSFLDSGEHEAPPKGGAAALLGWLLVATILLGGAGALAYVMFSQQSSRSDMRGAAVVHNDAGLSADAMAVEPIATPDASPASDAAATDRGTGSAAMELGEPNPVVAPVVKRPIAAATSRRSPAVAAEDKDPKALLKQSATAEARGDWDSLRSVNQKLEKLKGWAGPAAYNQAWAAFQMNDTPAALMLTEKAIRLPGPQRNKALLLRADTIFKQGDFKRAKDNYVTLRAMFSDPDLRATVTKKIALCNKQLGLPERDGMKD